MSSFLVIYLRFGILKWGFMDFGYKKHYFINIYTLLFFKKLCENILIFFINDARSYTMNFDLFWLFLYCKAGIYLCLGVISYNVLIYGRIYRKQKKFQSLELQIPSKNLF